jgi:hypothetical protein
MSTHADRATPEPRRVTGKISGLSYEAEACPECRLSDQLRSGTIGGVVGWVSTLLLGAPPFGRMLGAAAGIAVGAVAAKWHLRVDWDPEALKNPGPVRPMSNGPEAL